jgi:hypothetical protein
MPSARRGLSVLLVVVMALTVSAAAAGAAVDDPDVDTAADYEYRVDPEAGTVSVTIDLTVTADKQTRYTADGYYQYFFEGYALPIPDVARDISVTDQAGNPMSFGTDDRTEGFLLLEIRFRRNLFYGQTANIVVRYSLPPGQPRTETFVRVNPAYAGFEAWVHPYLEQASVSIVTPNGFTDTSVGSIDSRFTVRSEDDELWFEALDIDPEQFWSLVSLTRDSELTATALEVDDHAIEIRAWPGDQEWVDHVTTNLEKGLPALIDTVGLDWPVEDELVVLESFSPYLEGYGGWYDWRRRQITIGDELDDHVVMHELAHVWLNERLFDERWITEGLADVLAAEVVKAMGQDRPEPPVTALGDPARLPLALWEYGSGDAEQERWGYAASWTVSRRLADLVGVDTLTGVMQAADGDEISYVSDGEVEPTVFTDGWRRYLDLIENRGRVGDGAVVELFTEWVVPPGERPILERRDASRAAYAELETAGDPWSPPLVVREAMTAWRFGPADDLMAEATGVLETRDTMVERLEPVGAELPDELEQAYQGAEDLDELARLVDRVDAASLELRDAYDGVRGADGVFERIGALGRDLDGELAAAVDAFEDNDLAEVEATTGDIDATVDALGRDGVVRSGVAVVALALLGGGGAVVARRRRLDRGVDRVTGPTQRRTSSESAVAKE